MSDPLLLRPTQWSKG